MLITVKDLIDQLEEKKLFMIMLRITGMSPMNSRGECAPWESHGIVRLPKEEALALVGRRVRLRGQMGTVVSVRTYVEGERPIDMPVLAEGQSAKGQPANQEPVELAPEGPGTLILAPA